MSQRRYRSIRRAAARGLAVLLVFVLLASPLVPLIGSSAGRANAQGLPANGWALTVNPAVDTERNRASAEFLDTRADASRAQAVVAIRNKTAFRPPGGDASAATLAIFGVDGAYSLWVDPISSRNTTGVQGGGLLIAGGTTSWTVPVRAPSGSARQTFSARVNKRSAATDLGLLTMAAMLDVFAPGLTQNQKCKNQFAVDSYVFILKFAPEFFGADQALLDGRYIDALSELDAAMARVLPEFLVLAAAVVERCAEGLLKSIIISRITDAASGGLVTLVRVSGVLVRSGVPIFNFVRDVFFAKLPPTMIAVAYKPPDSMVSRRAPISGAPTSGASAPNASTPGAPAPGARGAGGSPDTATILVQDVSGSMGDRSSGGSGTKLADSIRASERVVDVIGWDAQATSTQHGVGVVAFSENARAVSPVSSAMDQARTGLRGLSTGGGTNLGAGLTGAIAALDAAPTLRRSTVILLSDGKNNTGSTNQQVLDGPVAQAAARGICIYTIAFGPPGDFDEDFLRAVASRSGCGSYFRAAEAFNLESAYLQVLHRSAGSVLHEASGTVAQGQRVPGGTLVVPADRRELQVTLNWMRGTLGLELLDPSGRKVEQGYPGAHLNAQSGLAHALVDNPRPGEWKAGIVGLDVPAQVVPAPGSPGQGASTQGAPAQGTLFTLIASSQQGPPGNSRTALVRSVLAGFLLALFALGLILTARERPPRASEDG